MLANFLKSIAVVASMSFTCLIVAVMIVLITERAGPAITITAVGLFVLGTVCAVVSAILDPAKNHSGGTGGE